MKKPNGYTTIMINKLTKAKLDAFRKSLGGKMSYDAVINVLLNNLFDTKFKDNFTMIYNELKNLQKQLSDEHKQLQNHLLEIDKKLYVVKKKKFTKIDFKKYAKDNFSCEFCNSRDIEIKTIYVTTKGLITSVRYRCNRCGTIGKIYPHETIYTSRFIPTTLPPMTPSKA